MNERISALMDGELGDAEGNREFSLLKGDAELRRTWDAYHLIGDTLRDHVVPGVAARVSARLATEPTVLAPARAPAPGRITQIALSAAAGVAAIALVAWMAVPAPGPDAPQVATLPAAAAPAVAVTPGAATAVTPAAEGVDNYLLAHQSFSPAGAMQGVAPYVRTVSEVTKDRSK